MSSNRLRCGDILIFHTRQAPGHVGRIKDKYHLFLGLDHDGSGNHVFMFISSNGDDSCMRIDQQDWSEMTKSESFINCRVLYRYTLGDLSRARARGRLSDQALDRLMNHAGESITLAGTDVDFIIDALRGYFES